MMANDTVELDDGIYEIVKEKCGSCYELYNVLKPLECPELYDEDDPHNELCPLCSSEFDDEEMKHAPEYGA